jgi:hypothetical protein
MEGGAARGAAPDENARDWPAVARPVIRISSKTIGIALNPVV